MLWLTLIKSKEFVTACKLHCSLYRKLVDVVKADGSNLDSWKWLEEKSLSSSIPHYWSLVINPQIEILVFIRSTREGNFHLYVQSLRNLLKWFFALDHTNYARRLTTHVFDPISFTYYPS